jgi:hypothetical protein
VIPGDWPWTCLLHVRIVISAGATPMGTTNQVRDCRPSNSSTLQWKTQRGTGRGGTEPSHSRHISYSQPTCTAIPAQTVHSFLARHIDHRHVWSAIGDSFELASRACFGAYDVHDLTGRNEIKNYIGNMPSPSTGIDHATAQGLPTRKNPSYAIEKP